MSKILEIKDLSKSYNNVGILNNISFDIAPGTIVGLLGPNGSGKTTLIKIITGLINDYNGDVLVVNNKPGVIANRDISYLPDNNSHIPSWFTPTNAIKFFTDFYSDFDKEKAMQMLETMSIPLNKKLKTLSRGMREKVSLSLVMSRKAKLYILDEPIGAVDPAARDFIINTIMNNFNKDSAIFLSTHIIADIEPALDNVVFLKDGQILLQGNADTIREDKGKSLDSIFREVYKHVT